MKTILFSISLFLFLVSCSDTSDSNDIENTNKVLLLQVDFMTNSFEGGKEYNFNSNIDSFTIASDYQAPGDFGNITLYYEELNEMLFDGSIVWAGIGDKVFPDNLNDPDVFESNSNPVSMPELINFENVIYSEYSYYPDAIDYTSLWGAIDELQLVTDYMASNPNGKINLFLYTPSVGLGDPNDWDWIVFLKN